jgi:VanZ family protein
MVGQPSAANPPSRLRVWRLLFVLACVCCLYFSLRPQGSAVPWFSHVDKVQHAGAFAVLAYLALKTGWLRVWQVFAVLSLFGLGIEIAQGMTTYRQADVLDWAADMAGVAVVLLPWWSAQRRQG